MKINRTTLIIFLSTFFIGCVSFAVFIYVARMQQAQSEKEKIAERMKNVALGSVPWYQSQPETLSQEERQRENPDQRRRKHKVKLMTIGEFHGDEVKAKTGEKWLGLFKENNNYLLHFTKIKIQRVRDVIADGDSKEKIGKRVSVIGNNQPIFLLKNARMLRDGKVTTLFQSSEDDYDTNNLPNSSARNFNLNGKNYTLKVTGSNSDEYLDPSSKLILISEGVEQVLWSGGCADCSWNLYWVGDLDKDGKLDLFVDLTDHYNVASPTLFLSSQAKAGNLVEEVAAFVFVGC